MNMMNLDLLSIWEHSAYLYSNFSIGLLLICLDWCCCLTFSFVSMIFNHTLKIFPNFSKTFLAVSGFFNRFKLLGESEGTYIYWIRDRTLAFLTGGLMLISGKMASSCFRALSYIWLIKYIQSIKINEAFSQLQITRVYAKGLKFWL